MKLRQKKRQQAETLLLYLIMIAGAIVFLLPFFWMLSTSFKSLEEFRTLPPTWFPHQLRWENYLEGLTALPFHIYFANTFVIAGLSTLGAIISSSWSAYAFAYLRFPFRNTLFILIISAMMLPFACKMIPLFLLFARLKMINTFLPLVIPAFFGGPFFVFLIRQFYRTIPKELTEAARIDGCSEPRIWLSVILPLSKPVLAVVAIFSVKWCWNDFLGPLIYLSDSKHFTVSLGLYQFVSLPGVILQVNLLMAAAVTVVVPIIVLFFMFQKYFVQGVTVTGLKG